MGTVFDVARSKGFRTGENSVAAIRAAKVTVKLKHHAAMDWRRVPALYADLRERDAIAAKALMFTCLTGSRTSEALGATWVEFDLESRLRTVPAARMKRGEMHRVPLTEVARFV